MASFIGGRKQQRITLNQVSICSFEATSGSDPTCEIPTLEHACVTDPLSSRLNRETWQPLQPKLTGTLSGTRPESTETGTDVGDPRWFAVDERPAISQEVLDSGLDRVSREHILGVGNTPTPSTSRPRKLRKRRSSNVADLYLPKSIGPSAKAANKMSKNTRSMNPLVLSPTQQCQLDLPKGIERRGKGIGFTFSVPTATHSNVSVCTTTADTCHGFFRRSATVGLRKDDHQAQNRESHTVREIGSWDSVIQYEVGCLTFAREPYKDSSYPGTFPMSSLSPSSGTAVNRPTSAAAEPTGPKHQLSTEIRDW